MSLLLRLASSMPSPSIELSDLRKLSPSYPHDLAPVPALLLAQAALALDHVLALPPGPLQHTPDEATLSQLPLVEVSLVDDPTIADIHARFFDDPTPTDVITFQHGEIILSVDTAHREAAHRQLPFADEILLYLIHGLLHLHGYHDQDPPNHQLMADLQTQILSQITS
jgi:probable rRNA maturation factor